MSGARQGDDARLAAACREGDEAAWAELYRTYAPTVARFLRRCAGPRADLDDMVQQVFVECFASIDRFRGDARLSTWMYRIAAHVAAREFRSRGRHERRVDALAEHVGQAPVVAVDPHASVEVRQALDALDEVLAGLKPKHRVVWIMSEVEQLSLDDIAAALKVRRGTVRSRLLTARKRVQSGLAGRGHGPAGLRDEAGAALQALSLVDEGVVK